jgi:hypothetical protein
MKRARTLVLGVGAGALLLLGLAGATPGSCVPIEPSVVVPVQVAHLSECGGFAVTGGVAKADTAADDYCAAEVLRWRYDATAGSLSLSDDRILLNCCGDHGIGAVIEDGAYVVTETDDPLEGGVRCHCLCVFDFALDVEGVPLDAIPVRLLRDIGETGETGIWEGTLDLTAGTGEVILDETSADPWCGEPAL